MKSVLDTISERHCKRAFTNKPVSDALITSVLLAARQAPSSKNTQPWGVAVVRGKMRDRLSQLLCQKFDQDMSEEPDYLYSPDPPSELFLERARECGYNLFSLKDIDRKDYVKRKEHMRQNYLFFGAPVVMVLHVEAGSERGNFLDMGLFLQNIMLGLLSKGIGSCPQVSLTRYSDTLRQELKLAGRWIVCGLSLGYVDETAIVNQYCPKRAPLDAFTSWFD